MNNEALRCLLCKKPKCALQGCPVHTPVPECMQLYREGKLAEAGELLFENNPLTTLFKAGIANELFPLLLFIGIGAMIDFGPLLSNPRLLLFGAAAQFGIFFTLSLATLLGFDLADAASISIIGAADGPTSIVVAQKLGSKYLGAIMVAAYSYMALVPIIQPPIMAKGNSGSE